MVGFLLRSSKIEGAWQRSSRGRPTSRNRYGGGGLTSASGVAEGAAVRWASRLRECGTGRTAEVISTFRGGLGAVILRWRVRWNYLRPSGRPSAGERSRCLAGGRRRLLDAIDQSAACATRKWSPPSSGRIFIRPAGRCGDAHIVPNVGFGLSYEPCFRHPAAMHDRKPRGALGAGRRSWRRQPLRQAREFRCRAHSDHFIEGVRIPHPARGNGIPLFRAYGKTVSHRLK